jgi:hypothetical protein
MKLRRLNIQFGYFIQISISTEILQKDCLLNVTGGHPLALGQMSPVENYFLDISIPSGGIAKPSNMQSMFPHPLQNFTTLLNIR